MTFIKEGKVNFKDCLNSKLPILIDSNVKMCRDSFRKQLIYQFYDHNGKVQKLRLNTELAEDISAIYGIDIKEEMNKCVQYELECMK